MILKWLIVTTVIFFSSSKLIEAGEKGASATTGRRSPGAPAAFAVAQLVLLVPAPNSINTRRLFAVAAWQLKLTEAKSTREKAIQRQPVEATVVQLETLESGLLEALAVRKPYEQAVYGDRMLVVFRLRHKLRCYLPHIRTRQKLFAYLADQTQDALRSLAPGVDSGADGFSVQLFEHPAEERLLVVHCEYQQSSRQAQSPPIPGP